MKFAAVVYSIIVDLRDSSRAKIPVEDKLLTCCQAIEAKLIISN
jgi:hypothetical protein